MKHERLMAILDCLLNEGKKTAAELSARFEVSERTVYRDIDSLCVAGVPVCAEAGTGGGYSIDPAYRVDRSFLTRDELRDLTGTKQPKRQADWLKARGWVFEAPTRRGECPKMRQGLPQAVRLTAQLGL